LEWQGSNSDPTSRTRVNDRVHIDAAIAKVLISEAKTEANVLDKVKKGDASSHGSIPWELGKNKSKRGFGRG